MKIKEYIEFKRQYFPPKVKVHNILDEGILAGGSPWVEGSDIPGGTNEDPFGGAKKSSFLSVDEDIEY